MNMYEFRVVHAMVKNQNRWEGIRSGWVVSSVRRTEATLNRLVSWKWAEQVWEDGVKFYRLTPKGLEKYYTDPNYYKIKKED